MSDNKFPLRAAIKAHSEEVRELTLRELTGADVRAVKALPYRVGADESLSLDMDAAAKYISRMAAIPLSSVDQLALSDLNELAWKVAGFFLSSESKAPSDSES